MSWSSRKDMGDEVAHLGGYKPVQKRTLSDLVWSGMKKLHTSAIERERKEQAMVAARRKAPIALAKSKRRKEFT